ncbi:MULTISPECIES: hypothetical protein [unclassified Paenibacillus]|uniref:hypothetical protein n=1 Tax=unclassified Paenibacillus TaxID=185978 RepID=UPI00096D7885|nr:hypothetical protein [Paenibacillus sp. FSL H8-0259]OMF31202.1 hypothetical protein BK132_07240 [Paenibacillus sp. FSL H8-0259]
METVHINNLRPGQYINHNGEVITLEQAKKLLESGAKPVLHTVSDEYIGRVLDSLHDARKAGEEPGDFCESDPEAKRIQYGDLHAVAIGPDRADIVAGYGTNEELTVWYRSQVNIPDEEWQDYKVVDLPMDKAMDWEEDGKMTLQELLEWETEFPQFVGSSE